MENKDDIFNEVFGGMLKKSNEKDESAAEPDIPLEALLEHEEDEHSYEKKLEEWMNTEQDYVPPYLNDPDYVRHVEKAPIPQLSREDEFSASTLGLQELRKTKKYIKEMHRAISMQLRKVYVTYPLLLQKHYEQGLTKAQDDIFRIIDDMEHFVAGDINKMERIKEDWQLYQEFEEKRLTLLHKINEYYKEEK